MMLNARGFFRAVAYLALPFAISPAAGCRDVRLSGDIARCGGREREIFHSEQASKFKTAFNTPEHRERLWNLSMQSVGLAEAVPV